MSGRAKRSGAASKTPIQIFCVRLQFPQRRRSLKNAETVLELLKGTSFRFRFTALRKQHRQDAESDEDEEGRKQSDRVEEHGEGQPDVRQRGDDQHAAPNVSAAAERDA